MDADIRDAPCARHVVWVFKGRGADQEAPSPSSAPLRGPAPSAPVRGPAPHQGDQQAIRCACSEIVRARLATLLRASVRAGYHHSSRADRWHEMPAVEVRTTESRRWRRGLRQHRTLGDNNCTGAVGGTGGAPSVVVVEHDTGNMHTPGLGIWYSGRACIQWQWRSHRSPSAMPSHTVLWR